MKSKIKAMLERVKFVTQHYSFVLLMTILAATSFALLIDNPHIKEEHVNAYTRFGVVCLLGISFLYSLNILSERIGKKLLLNFLGLGILAVYFQFFLPHSNDEFGTVHAVLMVASFVLSHLLVSFIAFLGKGNEYSFWHFNKNLFINVVLTGIFTLVLVGGILLAIAAVDQLFDLEFRKSIYPKTFVFLAILGSSLIFLLFNEDGLTFLEKEGSYPEILKFFVQYVLIPLLMTYVVILYLYGGRILFQWTLPRGWVSYLILAYSLVGILALLLVFPLRESGTKSWVKGFSKIFYYALFPLLVLLFVAIFTRILAYGFTENRYYVLLLAIWLAVVVFYFSFWRNAHIKFIPISLFAFGVFSLAFPYLNTFTVSRNSQKKELKEILMKNHLLDKGKINFEKPVHDTLVAEIRNKFDFLNERKESSYLMSFISQADLPAFTSTIKKDRPFNFSNVQSRFKNIRYTNEIQQGKKYKSLRISTEEPAYDIKGYDQMIKVSQYKNKDFGYDGNTYSVKGINGSLTLTYNGKDIDLSPEVYKIIDQYGNQSGEVYRKEISFVKEVGGYELKFILDQIDYNQYAGSRGMYYLSNDITILIRKQSQK